MEFCANWQLWQVRVRAEPWQMASPVRQNGDVCPLLPEHLDFAAIKTHLSRGFRWNA
jgi:hypothetical protein